MINNPSFRAPTPDEINELRADLVAAHAHIEHLHKEIRKSTLANKLVGSIVDAWEYSQCD